MSPDLEATFNRFTEEMRRVLEQHEIDKSDSWKTCPDFELVNNLVTEFHEFEIKNDPEYELIDIANSCLLLWGRRKFF